MNRETRMILAVYDTVILPDVDYRLNIGEISSEEKSRIKIDQNRAVILPTRTLKDHPQLEPEDFYPLGTAADIIDITENQMGTFLHMHTREKVEVTRIVNTGGVIEGECTAVDEIMDVTVEGERQLLEALKKTASEIAENIR
ncbi:MAG: LON peptidase substrate-binding domain-containing protein, partial [Lachnospiraceae bacterium]|nr:LON peptidase substrate-binding domain-containing protein [Lachnospiraceae bacterium]